MKLHDPALMTALLDGELKGWRRWLVRRHAANCPTCAVEFREQRHARKLLKDNPPQDSMSDSPDFFWSKVRAEIQQRDGKPVKIPEARLSMGDWLWVRPNPIVTVAIVAVALVATFVLFRIRSTQPQQVAKAPVESTVERVSAVIPNTVATPFHSDEADVTVIWVSGLPWTPDMNKMKTLYAGLDT